MKKDKQTFWLAATDVSCAKKFVWCSGTEVNITNYDWVTDQPNFALDQHCLAQYLEKGLTQTVNGLNDVECAKPQGYFCEDV